MLPLNTTLPERDGSWFRHIVCQGVEVIGFKNKWTRAHSKEAEEFEIQFRGFGRGPRYPNTDDGLHALRNALYDIETVFNAGSDWRFREIQKVLGIRT